MKALFAHDHRFYKHEKQVLSRNAFDAQVWERYLEHVDELVVAARIFELAENEDVTKYGVSNRDRVTFEHIPASHSWRNMLPKNEAQRVMNQKVASVDAVIARLPSRIGTMAVNAAKAQGKPYFIEVVGDPVESYEHHGSKILKVLAKRTGKTMQKNIASASHVLYVTQNELQKKYPTMAEQAGASNVEINDISEDRQSLRAMKIEACHDRPLKIGMIATLTTDYKGIDTAMEAIRMLKNQPLNLELHILGPGDKTKWQAFAEQQGVSRAVVFCGTLPAGQAVLEWLDDMDIYIQPSRTEGVPRALIEAMARGCPAVGSVAGGIPELLSPEYTHEIANAKELSEILADLMQTPEKQLEQSKQNIATAAHYTKPILQKRRAVLFRSFFDTVQVKEGN